MCSMASLLIVITLQDQQGEGKAANETTTKADFVGLLSPCSLLPPGFYHYPSLSNCTSVSSPIKTQSGADAFIVMSGGRKPYRGCSETWGREESGLSENDIQ